MRIAIDARKLHDFGIGTYIRNLVTSWARLDTATEYVLLTRPPMPATAAARRPQLPRGRRIAPSPTRSAEQLRIPLAVARARVDLLHEPHYVLPPLTRCRTVVTIHDCIHLRFPEYLPSRAAFVYAHAMIRAGGAQGRPRADRVGGVEARHPALHRRRRRQGDGHPQRPRRALCRACRTPRPSTACGSATSSITRSCSTSATSSRTRTWSA